jgi:hypothetical protein
LKLFPLSSLAAAAALTIALPAHAANVTVTGGWYSRVDGAQHETFDSKAVDDKDALNLENAWTQTGSQKSYVLPSTDRTLTCYEPGKGVGNYMCIRGGRHNDGQVGRVRFNFSSPVSYVGLKWYSVDGYVGWQDQKIAAYDGSNLLKWTNKHSNATVGARDIRPSIDDPASAYVNIFATGTEKITHIVLSTNVKSFEWDNLAILGPGASSTAITASVSQVPEPTTYAMLAAGLGIVGFIARRRRKA